MDLSLVWLISGVVFILAEFIIPGFVICFFGASAIVTSVICMLFPALPFAWHILIFTVLGAALLLACRKLMPGIFKGKEKTAASEDIDSDSVAGNNCICTETISPNAPGKVEFRGSLWNAVSSDTIPAGSRCIIKSRTNLTLEVTKL